MIRSNVFLLLQPDRSTVFSLSCLRCVWHLPFKSLWMIVVIMWIIVLPPKIESGSVARTLIFGRSDFVVQLRLHIHMACDFWRCYACPLLEAVHGKYGFGGISRHTWSPGNSNDKLCCLHTTHATRGCPMLKSYVCCSWHLTCEWYKKSQTVSFFWDIMENRWRNTPEVCLLSRKLYALCPLSQYGHDAIPAVVMQLRAKLLEFAWERSKMRYVFRNVHVEPYVVFTTPNTNHQYLVTRNVLILPLHLYLAYRACRTVYTSTSTVATILKTIERRMATRCAFTGRHLP